MASLSELIEKAKAADAAWKGAKTVLDSRKAQGMAWDVCLAVADMKPDPPDRLTPQQVDAVEEMVSALRAIADAPESEAEATLRALAADAAAIMHASPELTPAEYYAAMVKVAEDLTAHHEARPAGGA